MSQIDFFRRVHKFCDEPGLAILNYQLNMLYYIYSRAIPGFIHRKKIISSQEVIFTLWKYQTCYFHSVNLTSEYDVTFCIAFSVRDLKDSCSKTKQIVINGKFNVFYVYLLFRL